MDAKFFLKFHFIVRFMPKYSPFGIPFRPTLRYRGDFRVGGKEGLKPLRVWQGSWARPLEPGIWGLEIWDLAKLDRNWLLESSTPGSPQRGGGGSKMPHGDTPPPPCGISWQTELLYFRSLGRMHFGYILNPFWAQIGFHFGS